MGKGSKKTTRKLFAGQPLEEVEASIAKALLEKAEKGDVAAAKFLLANLFPERWSINPYAGKAPAAADESTPDAQPAAAVPGAPPFRIRLA